MSLAIATHTAPAAWRDEPDAVIVTALELLADLAEKVRRG